MQRVSPVSVLWTALAAGSGLFVATQPLGASLIGLAVFVFIVLAAVTPLAALMTLLVLAPMRTLIATEAPLQLPLDIGQITLIGLILAWASGRIVRGQRLLIIRPSPVIGAVLLFILVASLSAFSAFSLGAWLNEWLKWIQMLALIVLTVNLVKQSGYLWLVGGLTLAALANAIVGLYEFFGGSGALHLVVNDRFFRAFGTFGQPNPFGGFMGLVAPLALMTALGLIIRSVQRQRAGFRTSLSDWFVIAFFGVSALAIIAGILASWSRGAWLGFAASVLVMALALPRRPERGLIIAAGAAALVITLGAANLLPASIIERITSSTAEFFAFEDVRGVDITPQNYAVIERLAHWQAALNMANANPALGVGLGNYELAYPHFRLLNWIEPLGHAHNYYLNLLAEVGIIGLLGYGKAWLLIIWASWRARRHPDPLARFIVIGLLGTWTYLSVHNFFDNLYVNNLFLHLGLMLGILTILYNQTQIILRLNTA
jgi:O-antigen ligase